MLVTERAVLLELHSRRMQSLVLLGGVVAPFAFGALQGNDLSHDK